MDQKKIGQFIQTLRKSKGLTQKNLADELGVSDKTISKWEVGNGMPDITLIQKLCDILEINVNELLSSEKLSSDSYSEKAETNMLSLLTENKNYKRKGILFMIIGFILCLFALFYIVLINYGVTESSFYYLLRSFVDVPSLIAVLLFLCALIFLCKVRGKKNIARMVKNFVMPIGAFISLFELIGVLYNNDFSAPDFTLSIVMAISLLPIFYALIIYLIAAVADFSENLTP